MEVKVLSRQHLKYGKILLCYKGMRYYSFFENLVDFNEAHLHEAMLNLHTHM